MKHHNLKCAHRARPRHFVAWGEGQDGDGPHSTYRRQLDCGNWILLQPTAPELARKPKASHVACTAVSSNKGEQLGWGSEGIPAATVPQHLLPAVAASLHLTTELAQHPQCNSKLEFASDFRDLVSTAEMLWTTCLVTCGLQKLVHKLPCLFIWKSKCSILNLEIGNERNATKQTWQNRTIS